MEDGLLRLCTTRVLLVESGGQNASAMFDALRALGISQVTKAESAAAGLATLQDAGKRFNIAVVDLDNECVDSMDLINRGATRDEPAYILISSHDDELRASVNARALRHGVNILGVLPKPVRFAQLASLLSRYRGHYAEAKLDDNGREHAHSMWSADDLATALECRQFIPFFQPQIDLATGKVSSVEVLARWNHPKLGVLPAAQFIDVMEKRRLIDRLFDTVLCQSLECAGQWEARGWRIGLAVNVSPSTLQNPRFPILVSNLVEQHGIYPGRVTLELTETATCRNPKKLLEAAIRLRLRGFKLSADDFGTGYSSLQQLSDLPFTEIKIDRSLVTGLSNNRKASAIIESIVALANKLDMCTVAEGIESESDLALIRSLGCRFGQAYYLAKPMGNGDLVKLLDRTYVREPSL